jgi:toxin ParE1/3/4
MAKIELALEVGDDIEGILDPLAQYPVEDGPARIRKIILAIAVLEQNPLIGRPAEMDKRELIIGRRSRGDVA